MKKSNLDKYKKNTHHRLCYHWYNHRNARYFNTLPHSIFNSRHSHAIPINEDYFIFYGDYNPNPPNDYPTRFLTENEFRKEYNPEDIEINNSASLAIAIWLIHKNGFYIINPMKHRRLILEINYYGENSDFEYLSAIPS